MIFTTPQGHTSGAVHWTAHGLYAVFVVVVVVVVVIVVVKTRGPSRILGCYEDPRIVPINFETPIESVDHGSVDGWNPAPPGMYKTL